MNRHRSRRTSEGQRGQVVILTAIILPVLLGVAAFALDIAYLEGQRQATQMAADSAAQAGAITMAEGGSTATVKADATKYVNQNGFTSSNSTITVNVPPQSPPASGTYTYGAVQVVIALKMNPILAGVLGVTNLTSSVQAVATDSAPLTGPGLMWVLDKTSANSLQANGNACIDISGEIYVNSSSSSAVSSSGPGCGSHIGIEASTAIAIYGGYGSGCCSPTPTKLTSQFSDPLGTLTLPYYSGGHWYSGDGTQLSNQTSSGSTLNPGVYSGGLTISGGNITLNPGVYVMDGGGFNLSGNGTVTGSGVFIYNSSSTTPSSCGAIYLAGGGAVTFSSPTSGIYKGMAFAQDRSCATTATITGNNSMSETGALYFPDATLSMSGTGSAITSSADIIADKVQVAGTPMDVRKPDAAHTPAPAGVQLVE